MSKWDEYQDEDWEFDPEDLQEFASTHPKVTKILLEMFLAAKEKGDLKFVAGHGTGHAGDLALQIQYHPQGNKCDCPECVMSRIRKIKKPTKEGGE